MSMAAIAAVTLLGHAVRPIEHTRRALIGSTALAALVAAATWFAATAAPNDYPDADAPFLILSLLIIFGSFLVTTWFGWQLRSLDWQRPRRT